MKIIQNRLLTLACALCGCVGGAMFAFTAHAQNAATVTGRVTNASGQPEAASTRCVTEPGGSGTQRAVNTSRSNKKAALGADTRSPSAGDGAPRPAEAIISTSRSNIKRPTAIRDGDESVAEDGCTATGPGFQAPQAQREVKPVAAGSVVIRTSGK